MSELSVFQFTCLKLMRKNLDLIFQFRNGCHTLLIDFWEWIEFFGNVFDAVFEFLSLNFLHIVKVDVKAKNFELDSLVVLLQYLKVLVLETLCDLIDIDILLKSLLSLVRNAIREGTDC